MKEKVNLSYKEIDGRFYPEIQISKDKENNSVRKYIAERADLIGAIRLPNTALVNNDENFDLSEALNKSVQNLSANISNIERESEGEQENVISADPNVRNYTYTFVGDELYHRENAVMRKIESTGKNLERIKGLHSIREITREIIEIQTRGCSEAELKEKQEVLNKRYDSFVKNHGYITSRTNNTAFRDDNNYPLLCSLEVVDEDRNVTKADMFTKQTIRPLEKITEVDTANEAQTVFLFLYLRILNIKNVNLIIKT